MKPRVPVIFAAMIVICCGVVVLYAPTFRLPCGESDHYGYLYELKGAHSLRDGLQYYDYALSRVYAKGDEILYRPLLFVTLAFENFYLSYHYEYWNILNMIFYLIDLCLLLALLLRIQPSYYAILFVLAFAFSRASRGLVSNVHLSGYLLGDAFFLISLIFLYGMLKSERSVPPSKVLGYLFFNTAAVFFYELVIPFSFLAVMLLTLDCSAVSKKQRWLMLWIPPALYFFAYSLRKFSGIQHLFYVDDLSAGLSKPGHLLSFENLRYWPTNAFFYLRWFISQMFPWHIWFHFLALMTACLCFGFQSLKAADKIAFKTRLFTVLVVVSYVLFVSLMRGTDFRPYQSFFFYLFCFIAGYSLFDFTKMRFGNHIAAILLMGVFIMNNYATTQDEIRQRVAADAPLADYLQQIAGFVDQHKNEAGFSFRIANPPEGLDNPYVLVPGYPYQMLKSRAISTSECFFPKFYDDKSSKYTLTWNESTKTFDAAENRMANGEL